MGIIHNIFSSALLIFMLKETSVGRWAWLWADAIGWLLSCRCKPLSSFTRGCVFLVLFVAVGQRCYCNCGFLWIREEEKLAAPDLLQIRELAIQKRKKKETEEEKVWGEYKGSCSEGKQSVGGACWSAASKVFHGLNLAHVESLRWGIDRKTCRYIWKRISIRRREKYFA